MIQTHVRPANNAYLQRERDGCSVLFFLVSILVILPTVIMLLILVHWQNRIYKIGYELSILERNRVALKNRELKLAAERELCLSPSRPEMMAATRGLKPPTPDQIVVMD